MTESVRVDRTLQFGLNVTDRLGGGFGNSGGWRSNVG